LYLIIIIVIIDRVFSTPGGDFIEFAMALETYSRLTNQVLSETQIYSIFEKFMDKEISQQRPFYFHTDENRLVKMFANVSAELGHIVIQVLPLSKPPTDYQDWLDAISTADYQGCGHLRLAMQNMQAYGFTMDAQLLEKLLRVFLLYYWNDKTDKLKITFSVKQGVQTGRAVSIIKSVGGCEYSQPFIHANIRGSSSFVYSPLAVQDFRKYKSVPFFKNNIDSTINEDTMLTMLNELATKQLKQTLGADGLSVANQVNVFEVVANVKGKPNTDNIGFIDGWSPVVTVAFYFTISAALIAVAAILIFIATMVWFGCFKCLFKGPPTKQSHLSDNKNHVKLLDESDNL